MEYSKLISVTGMGGLFELIASKSDGAIVRSLDDKTTKFVSSRLHSFSHLESIEVYTTRENVNLVDVLKAMQASSESLPAEKDPAAVKAYFMKVYPDIDFDRVYASDMKKMVKWFGILTKNNIEIKLREAEPKAEETAEVKETIAEETPAEKKETKAKKELKADAASAEEVKEEKPVAKKTAKKKANTEPAAEEKEAPKKKAAKKKKEE